MNRCAVVVFPGSNCDRDAIWAWGEGAVAVWHEEPSLPEVDAVILPGGFSYGDYLRAGALARFSPIMADVRRAADAGMPVLGICNGFQILCEAGLLPGALAKNAGIAFRCETVTVEVADADTAWTCGLRRGERLRLPIAHSEGRYWVPDPAGVRIAFRYAGENPNGSLEAIAGVSNRAGNVVGLMPHPERAASELLGGTDGLRILGAVMDRAGGDRPIADVKDRAGGDRPIAGVREARA
jgi:phosphoribosylformylglycinamidine synthase I